MEPADRTRCSEGGLASISERLFALHGLEKHVSLTPEELCQNRQELFYIASYKYFTSTVVVLFRYFLRFSLTFDDDPWLGGCRNK